MKNVTNSFSLFMTETPETGKAYMDMVMKQSKASALDRKTRRLYFCACCGQNDKWFRFSCEISKRVRGFKK